MKIRYNVEELDEGDGYIAYSEIEYIRRVYGKTVKSASKKIEDAVILHLHRYPEIWDHYEHDVDETGRRMVEFAPVLLTLEAPPPPLLDSEK